MFWNAWKTETYVTNAFLFLLREKAVVSVYDLPKTLNDSALMDWGEAYVKLEKNIEMQRRECVVDSAFNRGLHPIFILSKWEEMIARRPEKMGSTCKDTLLKHLAD